MLTEKPKLLVDKNLIEHVQYSAYVKGILLHSLHFPSHPLSP